MKQKKVIIISPDTVPLLLKENAPENIIENGVSYNLRDKCCRATGLGVRSWNFAKILSQNDNFEVTLLVPNLNMPDIGYIDFSNIKFNIKKYNYSAASWDWSEDLDKILIKADFVILQSATGVGFTNCAVLPSNIHVILDGHVPLFAELPCTLLSYSRIFRKVFWSKFISAYLNVLKRSNCVLYASERQQYYYEGQFYATEKLDWSSYKFSPLLKIPHGVDKVDKITRASNKTLKLLWYGAFYPWYEPEVLLDNLKDNNNIEIDFVGVMHPRYKKVYNTYFSKYFKDINEISNFTLNLNFVDEVDRRDLYSKYDAGIVIARDWLEEKYSVRGRITEMLNYGLPVITNKGNSLFKELNYCEGLIGVDPRNIKNDLEFIYKNKDNILNYENSDLIFDHHNWNTVLKPLEDYIENF
jgi:hypothetical protein